MVDLQNLKNAINEAGFTDEAKQMMLAMIDSAIARGSMTADEKKKLQDIMEYELDQLKLEQNANEEVAGIIDGFLAEADSALKTSEDEMADLDEEQNKEMEDLKKQGGQPMPMAETTPAPTMTTTEQPAEAAMPAAPVMPTTPATEVPPQPPTQ